MKKIAYLGAFGVGNRGDDYLAYAFAQERAPSLYIGFARPHFDLETPFITLNEMASHPLLDFDVLTICGGSFVWSVVQLNLLLAIAKAIKTAGKGFTIRCVHVARETVWADPASFVELALLADEFTVRDNFSVGLCSDYGIVVRHEPDLLGQYVAKNYAGAVPTIGSDINIGFNFHNLGAAYLDWYFEYIGSVNHFSKRRVNLTYIVQCRHLSHPEGNERLIAEYLFTRLGGRVNITPVDSSLKELVSYFQAVDVMLSNRTHGLIIANALKLTTIASGVIDGKSYAQARDLGLIAVPLKENPHSAGKRVASIISA